MSVFDSLHETSNEAVDRGEKFVRTTKDYYKLKLFLKVSRSTNNLARYFVVGIFVSSALMFFSIALALFLGNMVDSISLGFVFVGLIYLLMALVGYMLRDTLKTQILKILSKRFFD